VLLALLVFGGPVLRNFVFAMLLGILIGTYSSIFIAAPILDYLGVKRDWSGVADGKKVDTGRAADRKPVDGKAKA
jgi:preprotein translocase subunit SecF/SecD/SecF fusion protein